MNIGDLLDRGAVAPRVTAASKRQALTVIAELAAYLKGLAPDAPLPTPVSVPFFDNSGPVPTFRRIA